MSDRGQLLAAARRALIAYAPFADLIGTDVGTDTGQTSLFPDQVYADGWVFQGISVDGRPARDPQSTGTSSVTLNCRTGWTSANDHNTARFPQLLVFIFSDLTRPTSGNGMIQARDAEQRCSRIAEVIENLFHDPANKLGFLGSVADFPPYGVFIHKSVQAGQLSIVDVANSDGVVKGELRFNLTTD